MRRSNEMLPRRPSPALLQPTSQLETLSQNLVHTRCVRVGKLMANAIGHNAANSFEYLRTIDQFLFRRRRPSAQDPLAVNVVS